jgi:thioredoxin reductase
MVEVPFDVIVVGGGAAGLSAALTLARARRRVLVIDAGLPRNRFSPHSHGVLGLDGEASSALLERGRDEAARFGTEFAAEEAAAARLADGLFFVTTASGHEFACRRLIVATGVRDVLPEIPGLAEQWGTGVVVCPYCDGYESRDRRIGVLATSPRSVHQAQLVRQWSSDLVYLVAGTPQPLADDAAALAARGIALEKRVIIEVLGGSDGVTVRYRDGSTDDFHRIFTSPRPEFQDELLHRLDARFAETPRGAVVAVDATGRTSVDGLWAVGNVTDASAKVSMAIGQGSAAAYAVNEDLVREEVELAVTSAGSETPAS